MFEMSVERKREFIKEKSNLIKDGFVIANYDNILKTFTVVCEKCGDNQVVCEKHFNELECNCECRLYNIRDKYDNRLTYNEVKEREYPKPKKTKVVRKINIKENHDKNINKETINFDYSKYKDIMDVVSIKVISIVIGKHVRIGGIKQFIYGIFTRANGDKFKGYILSRNLKDGKTYSPYIISKPCDFIELARFTVDSTTKLKINTGYYGFKLEYIDFTYGFSDLKVTLSNSYCEPKQCRLLDYLLNGKELSYKLSKEFLSDEDRMRSSIDNAEKFVTTIYCEPDFNNSLIKSHLLRIDNNFELKLK